MNKFIFYGWIAAAIALLLYSFTQVDLSLTLSQMSIWQGIQKFFQQIGYFNRPLSTVLYVAIIGSMFFLYGLTLLGVKKKEISQKQLFRIIIAISIILFFSYNAFSYDLFNYIFDAKIVTHYGQSPYEHKALDYPGDPMLSFMHWTHRTYPYGPVWLLLTVPLSFIGFGYFLVTFYLFKLLMVGSFIWSVYLIRRIAIKLGSDPSFSAVAFALNPLVLIESLVSAHIDIVMIAFGLFGILMFLERKFIASLIGIVGSIFIKFATALLIPGIIAKVLFKVKNETFLYILVLSMLGAVILSTFRTNFQPWYLLVVLPFSAFVQNKYFVMIPVFVVSAAALFQYVPFLYLGNWNDPVPIILNRMMIISVVMSALLTLFWKLSKSKL
ncbi:MAG: hypothetical protein A3C30_00825 [Candidatus Levybacteria bacterium RIFCSPHIGHO2_02_FULL_40_18]|nr:MAG: hypothetical protein A2869_03105 [Candidatus Levybacteria bacterium RIFCSPHIGHO2_01_FULL_40_58]OGH27243.1 MAG: hypothetical protein A3C30_00825 [Candidatus Levybacteria bacterium RIFCSPHIGHO2_02_FULL_40_18]OGH31102.1 MAG: hypothetical protein A3E43_05240 [Candidatus Levybacteria bacterium RIFCSPHIGHO2_12_FULL_40_31]OGH40730.1 MAG: hypothetical protein A2894_03200 [Candidatus Levybacteria bacterium RIFCSPLOWO2_01_FULL_40_64]OGH49369.1 MAG: hypothetical protein A3I54_01840 [Candidatus Lev